jgi:hypothetical protein
MKNNADFVPLLFQLFKKNDRYNSKIIVTRFADGAGDLPAGGRPGRHLSPSLAIRSSWSRYPILLGRLASSIAGSSFY